MIDIQTGKFALFQNLTSSELQPSLVPDGRKLAVEVVMGNLLSHIRCRDEKN